ncbi:MAG: VCBS repeat-containing protein [Chromatiales bacterium]|nr:VCBS repeat-containing protein [Chromatiales bacterium]
MYKNNGDGTFSVSDLTDQVAIPNTYSQGATFADYDNDGWKDLLVVNWGQDHLFHNEQGQGFVNVSQAAGIVDDRNSKSASWGDYDNDGFSISTSPTGRVTPNADDECDGEPDRLYHNDGDGTFTRCHRPAQGRRDRSRASSPTSPTTTTTATSTSTWSTTSSSIPSATNSGAMTAQAVTAGASRRSQRKRTRTPKSSAWDWPRATTTTTAIMDYYYSNVGPMELLRNHGDGTFRNVAEEPPGVQVPYGHRLGRRSSSTTTTTAGATLVPSPSSDTDRPQRHRRRESNSSATTPRRHLHTPLPASNEATDVRMSIGVAYADYDQDGWVDLVVGNLDEGYRLYKNQQGQTTDNHWLAIELVGADPSTATRSGRGSTSRRAAWHKCRKSSSDREASSAENDPVQYFGPSAGSEAQRSASAGATAEEQVIQNVRADCSVTRSSTVKQHYSPLPTQILSKKSASPPSWSISAR